MPQLGVARLAVEVLGHPVRLRSVVLIFFVLIVDTTVEVSRPFVLIWSTVLKAIALVIVIASPVHTRLVASRVDTYICVSCYQVAHVA